MSRYRDIYGGPNPYTSSSSRHRQSKPGWDSSNVGRSQASPDSAASSRVPRRSHGSPDYPYPLHSSRSTSRFPPAVSSSHHRRERRRSRSPHSSTRHYTGGHSASMDRSPQTHQHKSRRTAGSGSEGQHAAQSHRRHHHHSIPGSSSSPSQPLYSNPVSSGSSSSTAPGASSAKEESHPSNANRHKSSKDARPFSAASDKVLSRLLEIQTESEVIEGELTELQIAINKQTPPELASRRGKLAQLHGKLGKLLEAKIDAISTDGLQSGREAVRAKRKQLVKKSMRMQDQVEAVIKEIDGMLRKIRKEGETVARNLESLDIYKD